MNRESVLYKIRRWGQTVAFHLVSKKTLSKFYFKIVTKKTLDLENPKTLNEKIQWLKLYYLPSNPLVVQCTDKYQVREYIEQKGYANTLTKLLGVWENAKDIAWDALPDKFVLKCTHGCAYNLICKDKRLFDKKAATKQLNHWLKEDFSAFNVELHYGKIRSRKIICEEFLGEKLIDYKFFCFHGEPKFFYVSSDLVHDRQAQMGFFEMNGNKIPLIRNDYADIGAIELPNCYSEMVEEARNLAREFPFVRVDFFFDGESFKFAELTFTPGAAMMPFNPPEYDLKFGDMLNIDDLLKKGKNS